MVMINMEKYGFDRETILVERCFSAREVQKSVEVIFTILKKRELM